MLKEFKEFAMRGNVVDLAIGVIIGGAFGTIVSSFVKDILTPPLGLLTGGLDFSAWKIPLSAISDNATSLNIGLFINAVINFAIVAFALFVVVRQINKLKGPAPAPPAPTTCECPFCISAIPKAAKRCPHCTAEVSPILV